MDMTTPVQSLTQLDFESLSPTGGLFPSLIPWEDQVFYFLMLDRFDKNKIAILERKKRAIQINSKIAFLEKE